MRATLIGIDLGTSAVKGVLLAADGRVLARERCATELLRPRPGWVEFSAPRCYEILLGVVGSLARAAPPEAPVTAIALSGATGNALLMDRQGRPLGNAIHWMDARSVDDPRVDPSDIDPADIHRIVGWPYFRGFPLVQLAWLRQNQPHFFATAAMVAMNITYLYHRLCGRFGMDHSTATTFYLQDQFNRRWHKPFLDWLGIQEVQLPTLLPSGSVLGQITADAAAETGLPTEAAVVLGAFDHPSAARGVGVLKPGEVLLSCGTSWVGFYPVTDREQALSRNMLVDPFLWPTGPWGALFSLPRVGEKVHDFVNQAFAGEATVEARYARFNEAAGRATRGSTDPCRSLMQNIVNEMKARLDMLANAGLKVNRLTMVGGPTDSAVWTQMLADELRIDIHLPEIGAFAGALGAAVLAGIGRRIFADEADAVGRIGVAGMRVQPAASSAQ